MADLDPNRAAFVKREYRYFTSLDGDVLARNPAARVVEVDTNMDEGGATALAHSYLAENVKPRAFELTMQGTISIDNFLACPPAYVANFPRLRTDGRTMKAIAVSIDYDAETTSLRVRG